MGDLETVRAQAFIGGVWIGDGDLAVTNPSTGAELARVPNLGMAGAQAAIAAADAALGPWGAMQASGRSAFLRNWFDLIEGDAERLARLLTAEQGKPLHEARAEIAYAASYIAFYAEEATRVFGETIPAASGDSRIVVIRQPVGVVAAITPWNFPAAMVTRKIAPALAAGCTTVLKPAPETPLTAIALAELAERAGLPAGCLNVITGDAETIGTVLCASPVVRGLTFTGSTPIGRLLMAQCAPTLKRLGLELGGNAPFLVFDDADLDAAVDGAMISKFRNAGQTCVCANRFYVQDGIHDAFVARLSSRIAALKVGDGMAAGTDLGPLISAQATHKVLHHIEDALEHGAQAIVDGRTGVRGAFIGPTLLVEVTQAMRVTCEETFGPLLAVARFETEQQAIAMANASEYGLAAYYYTRDVGRAFRVGEQLEAGMVALNTGVLSNPAAPFGGIKQSGQGREGSRHGLDEFTELKTMTLAGMSDELNSAESTYR